ncbi:biopolymer transporter ExbD [Opitutaceae bacterium EW11]|nr:biopolymer transporter ExbD [Opitutaceae bacterium EW11]
MSGLGLRIKRHHRPELPLVPLIDVLVMLVLFSFVTMRFASTQTLNITLPKVETAGKNLFDGTVTLSIDKDGLMRFNGKPATRDQLRALLAQVKNINRDTPVLISADEKTPLEHVTFVMDVCRQTGLNKFSLQSR